MRTVEFKLVSVNSGDQYGVVKFTTEQLIELVVDYATADEILDLMKKRLLENVANPKSPFTQAKSQHEHDLKVFLERVKS